MFVDICSGHNENEGLGRCLKDINTDIRKLTSNATDIVQPADSFIISKIKDVWRREWDILKAGDFAWFLDGQWTGFQLKAAKYREVFFLKLAANAVREVNMQRDKNGI